MNQFNTHCNLNETTTIHQSAYKQFHSCETAFIKIVDDALWAMDHNNITIFVIMHLCVAFDTVNLTVLFEVLHICIRIEGLSLEWFHSYLSSRFFQVNIGDVYSNLKELNFSVPHGSCASPSLFNAYSSTVANYIPNYINIGRFADDHSLLNVFWLVIKLVNEEL